MENLLVYNALIVNEGARFKGSILIQNKKIQTIFKKQIPPSVLKNSLKLDAQGKYVLPGIIDVHVHFREPGLTHKGDIFSESKAAIAGGITSFMEMPNTNPQTITQDLLEEKYEIASRTSLANFSFYMGATNNNLEELIKTDPTTNCGIKVFMGASTGNMLVDDIESLKKIFLLAPLLIAVHCEDESTIQKNSKEFKSKYDKKIPVQFHPFIRSAEACYKSSSLAIELAKKNNTRLHLLHISTAKETGLLDNTIPAKDKQITAEVCVHHLLFDNNDYKKLGTRIKWNPAIKTRQDRKELLKAVLNNKIDVIATDHAPHTIEEKQNSYLSAPSGGPFVQHSLVTLLEFYHQGKISLEKIVEKMCHTPADIFQIEKRGYIRKGYYGDLVIVDLNTTWTVTKENILYKCKWSPLEGQVFHSKITHTIVNGNLVYENQAAGNQIEKFDKSLKGQRLFFNR